MTLPISEVTMRPRSSFCRRKILAASSRSSPRRGGGILRHLSNAPLAARTAAFNSSPVPRGKVARTSPVAGFRVSNRLASDFFHLPPMKRPYSWTIVAARRGCKVPRGYDLIPPPTVRPRLGWAAHDRRRGLANVVRDHVGRPGSHLLRESLPPGRRSDPSGPASERATCLDIEDLVAHHPGVPRPHSEVACRGEEHPGPRLPARAVGEHVVGTEVNLRDMHPFLPKGREHPIMDARELTLRDQLPSRSVLVRTDHETPTMILQESKARNRSGKELELLGRADVPGSPAVDDAVAVQEHGRPVRRFERSGQSVPLHSQGVFRLGRLKEPVDEAPLRERVPRQGEAFVDRKPRCVLNLIRLQSKPLGLEMAAVDET